MSAKNARTAVHKKGPLQYYDENGDGGIDRDND